jgi:hypothetical protein
MKKKNVGWEKISDDRRKLKVLANRRIAAIPPSITGNKNKIYCFLFFLFVKNLPIASISLSYIPITRAIVPPDTPGTRFATPITMPLKKLKTGSMLFNNFFFFIFLSYRKNPFFMPEVTNINILASISIFYFI